MLEAFLPLLEGADKNKDQSYFLALLSQEQLRDARFPIGHLPKPELRAIARDAGLPTADKKDSQGICFIGEVKMSDFLRAYVPDAPGPIVRATDGRELGTHRGLHFYTLGQRKGIGIPSNTDHEAYVVVGKRATDRALLVAFDHPERPASFNGRCAFIHSVGLASPSPSARRLEGRVRYRDPRVPIVFTPDQSRWKHRRVRRQRAHHLRRAAARPRQRPGPRALRRRRVARRRNLHLTSDRDSTLDFARVRGG